MKKNQDEKEYIILVDEKDNETGTCEKLEAHEEGLLHRAFSIFVFNKNGELLMQQRAADKYHSGGLWTNTCCSHYHPDEDPEEAPSKRLLEEMGFTCELTELLTFTYKTFIEKDELYEHETDHVFMGTYHGTVKPDPAEVENHAWANTDLLLKDIERNPDKYTYWFKELLPRVLDKKN